MAAGKPPAAASDIATMLKTLLPRGDIISRERCVADCRLQTEAAGCGRPHSRPGATAFTTIEIFMLFRRREPQTLRTKLLSAIWPRRSWRRSITYLKKRVLRLNAKPHAIAAGVAAGVLSSFTPFIGFHFVIAFAVAFCLSGNMAAAALGCIVGNPLTFPAIWAATYEVGRLILGVPSVPGDAAAPSGLTHALTHGDFSAIWEPILKPMLVGSVPLGFGFGAATYGVVYLAARSFQRRRAIRLQERRAEAATSRGQIGTAA